MYSLIQLKTLVSCGRDLARSLPRRRGFLLIPLILVCFAFLPKMQAGTLPDPVPDQTEGKEDGCYINFATAEGCGALNGNQPFTGLGNSAIGWRALFFSGASFWNTGVGAGALAINTGNFNTATGAGALLLNLDTSDNTADGAFALIHNQTTSDNTAVGSEALFFNDDSDFGGGIGAANDNTAVGSHAMEENVNGFNNTGLGSEALEFNDFFGTGLATDNTAVGYDALQFNVDGFFNSAVGSDALIFNSIGSLNNAFGFAALAFNDNAFGNTAMGVGALEFNDSSTLGVANENTAVGFAAMINNVDGTDNTVVGAEAGQNLVGPFPFGFNNTYVGIGVGTLAPDESSTIRIADLSDGNGAGSLACFIGGIWNNFQPVGGAVVEVTLDLATDELGWDIGPSQGGSAPSVPSRGAPAPRGKPAAPIQRPTKNQAMLNDKVEKLQVVVQMQQKQIVALTAQLKEQATQIDKVSAQLEMMKPAPRVVENR